MCERQEQLVGFIYDEISDAERREMQAHLAICAECRAEVDDLQSARTHLSLWAPPEPDLGFRLIRGGPEPAVALPRRWSFAPAFAFAAAATIVLAVAAAIANIEIRYDDAGLVMRTGWSSSAPVTQAAAQTQDTVTTSDPAASGADVAAITARLNELEAALTRSPAGAHPVAVGATSRMSDAEIVRFVRTLVTEAESRQRVALAQGLLQVFNDFDRQRRADLVALQQGIGQYQGVTNAEMAHTRDIVNQLMRVATKQEK